MFHHLKFCFEVFRKFAIAGVKPGTVVGLAVTSIATKSMYFTTSTIIGWPHLFMQPRYRDIIMQSLQFMVNEKRIRLHGYVIMPSHIHTLFTVNEAYKLEVIFRDFHKYTAQQILRRMKKAGNPELERFVSLKSDREYQFWKPYHAPRPIESTAMLKQKLEYIHRNPCAKGWHLCDRPEEYEFSSAAYYYLGRKGPIELELLSLF